MSAPICPTHGEGFGSPCYLCVDAENRTLRALYAEAVRACNDATDAMLRMDVKRIVRIAPPSARCELEVRAILHAVLSRPEAQEVLRG